MHAVNIYDAQGVLNSHGRYPYQNEFPPTTVLFVLEKLLISQLN
jgi:hypothetical protein